MAVETEESGGQDKNGRVGMYRRAMCKRHGEKSLVFTTNREILRTCLSARSLKTRNATLIIRIEKMHDVSSFVLHFDADYFLSDYFE